MSSGENSSSFPQKTPSGGGMKLSLPNEKSGEDGRSFSPPQGADKARASFPPSRQGSIGQARMPCPPVLCAHERWRPKAGGEDPQVGARRWHFPLRDSKNCSPARVRRSPCTAVQGSPHCRRAARRSPWPPPPSPHGRPPRKPPARAKTRPCPPPSPRRAPPRARRRRLPFAPRRVSAKARLRRLPA